MRRAKETKQKDRRQQRERLFGIARAGISINEPLGRVTSNRNFFDQYLQDFFYGLSGDDPPPYPLDTRTTVPATIDWAAPGPAFGRKEEFFRLRMFRKHRFEAYRLTLKSENEYLRRFKAAFGGPDETTVIVGDWDSRCYTPRGQVPTKGKGFRQVSSN